MEVVKIFEFSIGLSFFKIDNEFSNLEILSIYKEFKMIFF